MSIYKQIKGEIEFYPKSMMQVLKAKLGVLVILTLIGAVLAYAAAIFLIEPKYESSISVYVNNLSEQSPEEEQTITSNDIAVSESLVNLYAQVLKSNTVLDQVIENAGLELSAATLKNMISVETQADTSLFKIYVTDTDAKRASEIAETISVIGVNEIVNIVKGSSATVIDNAQIPTSPSSPNYKMFIILGAMLGLFVAITVVMGHEITDQSIKTANDLQEWNIPVLGTIPEFSRKIKSEGKNR